MDITGNYAELKKDIYDIQHVLISDLAEDVKWKSVQKLRKYLVEREFVYLTVRFSDLLSIMLERLNVSSSAWKDNMADDFFLKSYSFDSFISLLQHIDRTNSNEDAVADLLEKFIVSSNLKKLILDQCTTLQQEGHTWDEIIVCLTSLPERTANRFKMKTRDIFCPDVYVKHLVTAIYCVLQNVQEMLILENDINLEFVSRLLGKLCIVGYADISFDYLYPHLICMMRDNFLWRRICQCLISGVPPRCMESVLTSLLQKISWYGHVEWILGDTVNYQQNIQYLLTTKFLFIRYFEKDSLPKNVIGYLAHSEKRKPLFHKVVLSLLDVWSDGSALKHQPYSQQLYLSRLLMIATGHLKVYGIGTWKQDFMERLLKGVHDRIASSLPSTRILGMVVAESMSVVLNAEGPKLQFEYEESQEILYLYSLLIIPQEPELNCKEMKEIKVKPNISETKSKDTEDNVKSISFETCKGDLDSDDDLEAYDLSVDKMPIPGKQPLYLIECLKGLMDQEKAEWLQTCLECTEDLIRQKPDNLNEIAIDLCKVLLHLENLYSLSNFANLKQGSLVALCVHCPAQIANFLSTEFYNKNYSIRQRTDILQVLAAASRELSGIESISNTHAERSNKIIIEETIKQTEENWKSIVARRIASKSRVISKKRKEASPKENKFAHVAGHFFFNLLTQFDRAENTFDLLGSDSYLLGHFIYTLGIIMCSAINIPIAGQMGKCLLEFIWTLKYHNDKFVQKALLFSLCMILSSVPSYILLSDFQEDIFDCKQWLQSIICESFDSECKMMANQALSLMLQLLKEEGVLLHSITEI